MNFGDTVTLDPGYDAPDFMVGAPGESTVNLQYGDVVRNGSALYRYNGSGANNFQLTGAAITGDSTDFQMIGGQAGATYQYTGTSASVDLANTNYTNTALWTPVTAEAAVPAPAQTTKDVSIRTGDTVAISPSFPAAQGAAGSIYEYIGPGDAALDLDSQNYATDAANWKLVSATNNTVYQFMGPSGTNVDLSNGELFDSSGNAVSTVSPGYFDLGHWRPLLGAQLQSSTGDGGSAIGGVVVVNEVDGGAYAIVQNSTVFGASLAVTATNNATIDATATAIASAGSSFGDSNTKLAVNASIAINEILGDADAHIVDSTVYTTSGDVNVTATNSADIEASTMSAVSVTGTGTGVAVGFIMAANTVGTGFQDLLASAVDTIAGGNVLGTSAPTETTAYIKDSSVNAAGALNVSSTSTETVNATVGNETLADIEPSDGARSYSAGAVVSINQILTSVTAYIDNDNSTGGRPAEATVTSGAALTVSATDDAGISASTTMTALGTPAASAAADEYAALALSSYKYTNRSTDSDHKVTLNFGDQVAVQDPTFGIISVYRYLGTTATDQDLSTTDFTNLDLWKPLSTDQLTEEAEAQSANPMPGDDQGGAPGELITKPDTPPPSGGVASLYVLFDYNNVASSTAAYISSAIVRSGSVAIAATDDAAIEATDDSVVTTNSGGFGAGGVVATNHVTGSVIPSDPSLPPGAATAFIANAIVTATTGDVTVDAESNGDITSMVTTALTADGAAVSIEAAFNVIGWSNDNFGSLALAALIGTDQLLGTATPYATQAFITDGSTVTALGNVSVTASGQATITATVDDQAATANATARLNVGGILATNKIDTATNAYIGTAAPTPTTLSSSLDSSCVTAIRGTLTVSATDIPTLTATSTITLSSTALTGGVASALSGDYSYTENSGRQTLHKGDKVRVQTGAGQNATATVYTYQGSSHTPASGDSIDLTDTSQYTQDPSLWKAGDDASASINGSAAESKAIGFNLVLNDVRGAALATIAVARATISGGYAGGRGGIVVTANEAASIEADTESNLTSTGSGNGSQSSTGGANAPAANTTTDAGNQPTDGQSTTTPAGGLALGGAVVTNLVLAASQASIQGATLDAGKRGINIDAEDTAQLDATTLVASSTGGAGSQANFNLAIAFNSIGYAPENFLFNAVDALLGSDYLSNPTPDNATAYLSDVIVSADPSDPASVGDLGFLSVTAESNEQVNATVSNAASSTTSAVYDASSTGFGGIVVSNKVNASPIAYIDESGISGTANPINIDGGQIVSATDNSGIFSNDKLVSSAIVTDNGGTSGPAAGGSNSGGAAAGVQASAPATLATGGLVDIVPTYTALGGGATPSYHNPQNLETGDAVLLDETYDTLDYTVGAGSGTVDLQTGNVILDGATLYRYVGTGANAFSLTDANITSDPTDFKVVGGVSGDIYTYIGSGAQVDLANTDYNDASNWQRVDNLFVAPVLGAVATVAYGDEVELPPRLRHA